MRSLKNSGLKADHVSLQSQGKRKEGIAASTIQLNKHNTFILNLFITRITSTHCYLLTVYINSFEHQEVHLDIGNKCLVVLIEMLGLREIIGANLSKPHTSEKSVMDHTTQIKMIKNGKPHTSESL